MVSCYIRCQCVNWHHLDWNTFSSLDVKRAQTAEVIFSVLETSKYPSTEGFWGWESRILRVTYSLRVLELARKLNGRHRQRTQPAVLGDIISLTCRWEVEKLHLSFTPGIDSPKWNLWVELNGDQNLQCYVEGGALELSLGLLSGCNNSRPQLTLIPCVAATVSPSCFEMLLNMFCWICHK